MDKLVIAYYKGYPIRFTGNGNYYLAANHEWYKVSQKATGRLAHRNNPIETVSTLDLSPFPTPSSITIEDYTPGEGGVSGYKITCTCGTSWTTSLSRTTAELQANDHARWHLKQEKKRGL